MFPKLIECLPASPFGQAAPHLYALCFSPLPLVPGEKRPIIPDWQEYCARQPTEDELFHLYGRYRHSARGGWKRNSWQGLPNIGLACGTPIGADHILVAVDIDCDDERLIAAVPQSTMAKCSTNHGETRFFRASPEITSQAFDRLTDDGRERLVDILASGRQTAVPPSIHPNGQPYRWFAGPVAASELPIFTSDDFDRLKDTIEAMRGFRTIAIDRRRSEPGSGGSMWREVNDAAIANLDAWVPALPLFGLRQKRGGFEAVATWRQSSSGRPLNQRKRNLSIIPAGIRDFGTDERYSPVDLVAIALGIEPGRALDWLKDHLGFDDGQDLVIVSSKRERIGS